MRPNDEISCADASDFLEPYLDGDLPPREADRLREHLESCAACAAELALAERIQRELRSLPQLDCPPELIERVVRKGRGEVVPFPERKEPLRWRIAAAAVVALTLGGGSLFVHLQDQRLQRERQVAQATQEARFALAYLGRATHKVGLDVRDEVLQKRLVIPTARSVSRSLSDLPNEPRKEF